MSLLENFIKEMNENHKTICCNDISLEKIIIPNKHENIFGEYFHIIDVSFIECQFSFIGRAIDTFNYNAIKMFKDWEYLPWIRDFLFSNNLTLGCCFVFSYQNNEMKDKLTCFLNREHINIIIENEEKNNSKKESLELFSNNNLKRKINLD